MSGEDMAALKDGSFDVVMTSIFLHELSAKSLPKIMSEGYRVLKDEGLMVHLEQPQYSEDMPVFEQFIRDWDSYNNNEPFWSAMHDIDLIELMKNLGFDETNISYAPLGSELNESTAGKPAEDFGRNAAWHAYVGRK